MSMMVTFDLVNIEIKAGLPRRNGQILTKDDRVREHPVVVAANWSGPQKLTAEDHAQCLIAAPRLEKNLGSVLDDTSRIGTIEPAETPRVTYIVVRHGQLCVIPGVEEFNSDLSPDALGNPRSLEQRQIGIPNRRAAERVSRQTAV